MFVYVTKEVPGTENTMISGTFLTRVYDGQFKEVGKWVSDLKDYVKSKGKTLKDLYFYYTTCPKCACPERSRRESVLGGRILKGRIERSGLFGRD